MPDIMPKNPSAEKGAGRPEKKSDQPKTPEQAEEAAKKVETMLAKMQADTNAEAAETANNRKESWWKNAFNKAYSGYKWLGEQNLTKFFSFKEKEEDGKWTKRLKKIGNAALRGANLRTLITGSLAGAGLYIGWATDSATAAAGLGMAAYGTKRAGGMIGATGGALDLERMHDQKTFRKKVEQGLESGKNIPELLQEFHARAMINGKSLEEDSMFSSYKQLEHRYKMGSESSPEVRAAAMEETLKRMQEGITRSQGELLARNKKRKAIATAMGLAFGNGAAYVLGRELLGLTGKAVGISSAYAEQPPSFPSSEPASMPESQPSTMPGSMPTAPTAEDQAEVWKNISESAKGLAGDVSETVQEKGKEAGGFFKRIFGRLIGREETPPGLPANEWTEQTRESLKIPSPEQPTAVPHSIGENLETMGRIATEPITKSASALEKIGTDLWKKVTEAHQATETYYKIVPEDLQKKIIEAKIPNFAELASDTKMAEGEQLQDTLKRTFFNHPELFGGKDARGNILNQAELDTWVKKTVKKTIKENGLDKVALNYNRNKPSFIFPVMNEKGKIITKIIGKQPHLISTTPAEAPLPIGDDTYISPNAAAWSKTTGGETFDPWHNQQGGERIPTAAKNISTGETLNPFKGLAPKPIEMPDIPFDPKSGQIQGNIGDNAPPPLQKPPYPETPRPSKIPKPPRKPGPIGPDI